MGLWGATDADESKPKHLTTAEKKQLIKKLLFKNTSKELYDIYMQNGGGSDDIKNFVVLENKELDLDNYNAIDASDFRVECDYEALGDDQSFLVPMSIGGFDFEYPP